MLKVGALVRYEDGDIGIVIIVDDDFGDYYIQWGDGCCDWHVLGELEVICK